MKLPRALVLLGALALLVASAGGCAEPKSFLVHRPENDRTDAAITAMWAREIATTARDGDWILTRSYYAAGDAIALFTRGEDLSHASIYDANRGTVIEAVGSGVREIPLAQLVQRNHYVIVVRPANTTAAEGTAAVARARTVVGAAFDTAGMLGLQDDRKFYCSELVWWSSQGEARTGVHPTIITPADLMGYGEVIYWSGKRDDAQVQSLASARAMSPPATRTAARGP